MTVRAGAGRRDDGSIAALMAVAVVALLLVAGLVVDGGAKVRAAGMADRLAAEAGRAAAQAIDVDALNSGGVVRVDRVGARSAARSFLARAGHAGTVDVSGDGTWLTVVVPYRVHTLFLGLIGVGDLSGTGSATTVLVPGVTGPKA